MRPRPPTLTAAELAERSSQRVRTPLLPRELSDAEFELFRHTGTRRELDAGARIFRRGEPARARRIATLRRASSRSEAGTK